MFTRSRKLTRLPTVPLFSELSRSELRLIETLVDEVVVPPGTRLAGAGGHGMELVVILEGHARATLGNGDTLVLGPREFLGVITALDGGGYWATVEAVSQTRVLVSGERAFSQLLEVAPRLTVRILSVLSRRARRREAPHSRPPRSGTVSPVGDPPADRHPAAAQA